MNIPKYIDFYRKELELKKYRKESINNYTSCLKIFLEHFKDRKDHEHINENDIKSFLVKFKEQNTQRAYHSAIKCFYKYVCRQPNKFKYIEYCKRNRKLPIVLSVDEMRQLIFAAENLKHKTIICLMYSTGMRVGEVINLKIKDIDSKRMVIYVKDAKGGKDRIVNLDPIFLNLCREYYKEYKPINYLFNGQKSEKYTTSSIAQFLQKYADIAKIDKRVHPHLIRHCSFTHLLEGGLDMTIIQKLAGHSSIKTTQLYGHISHNFISNIKSPLLQIPQNNLYLQK